ncbi:MAG: O-antigen translocase [Flavobacteriaceae bacterium]|jgi:PST family polysaccharide transporter|nr:O-antigen translocase [Flavobacteriaceae bacterium]
MNFIKTSFLSGLSTAISLIARLISTKIVAVYLGTNGMFLMGQLKDFLRLGNTISSFGIENGIIKYTSEFEKQEIELKGIVGTSFKINFFSALIVSGLILVFKEKVSDFLQINFNQNFYFLILICSVISASIHTCFLSIYNGLKKIELYVLINIFSNILSAIVIILLVLEMEIIGAFYALALNQILSLLINVMFYIYYRPFKIKWILESFITENLKKLSKFSVMAIAGPTCLIISTFIIRDHIYNEFGSDYAGSWEAMWRISAIYLLFLITTFKFYLIPTFSKVNDEKLKQEVFKIWKVTIPIIIIITIGVYLTKNIIIDILLSQEFVLINVIIFFHLLGDVIKINCWVLGNIMISKADTKSFVFFQIEWSAIFIILSYLFIDMYGFVGVSISYFITYIIHFMLLNLYYRKLLWLK